MAGRIRRLLRGWWARAGRLWAGIVRAARRERWRRPGLALLFLVLAVVAAQQVLPVHPAPKERPAKVVALPPTNAFHGVGSGYVISLALTVESCSDPVEGFMTVVLPKDFFALERSGGEPLFRRPLFGAAFSDPEVEVSFVGPDSAQYDPDGELRSWAWSYSDGPSAETKGTVAAARFDGWHRHPDALSVSFSADWLRPRGYGSCWLPTPELVGDLGGFAISSADEISRTLGPQSGADHLSSRAGVSGVVVRKLPDGTVERRKFHEPMAWDYVDWATPPALGFVSLETPLSVLPGDSVGPAPTVGHPTWRCREERGRLSRVDLYGLDQDGQFSWYREAPLHEYEGLEAESRCDSWVALVEQGAESERDIWLLLIGAAFSAGMALAVDAVLLPRRRRQRAQAE